MPSRSSATRRTPIRRSAPRHRNAPRRLTLDALDAQPIPARLPAADQARAMRFYAKNGADTRQMQADLEADLRFEAWMGTRY